MRCIGLFVGIGTTPSLYVDMNSAASGLRGTVMPESFWYRRK